MVGEEPEWLHLSDPWEADRRPSTFSELVQLEEKVEGEAPRFDSERVGVNGLPRAGYEIINGHGLPGHHVFVEEGIDDR